MIQHSNVLKRMSSRMVSSIICCFLLFACSSYGIEYPNNISLHGDSYIAYWKFDNETATFFFKVEVNATGWIAFGVSRLLMPSIAELQWNIHSMEKYDVIVAGVFSNSTTYNKDCMTNGHKPPTVDQQQDWIVSSLTESDGKTILECWRMQNTSDEEGDNVIEPGLRWIVWAYHATSDDIAVNWTEHTEHGSHEIELIKLPREVPVIEYYGQTENLTTGASAMAASIIGNFLLLIIVVIFFY